jgi:hypothetical protein
MPQSIYPDGSNGWFCTSCMQKLRFLCHCRTCILDNVKRYTSLFYKSCIHGHPVKRRLSVCKQFFGCVKLSDLSGVEHHHPRTVHDRVEAVRNRENGAVEKFAPRGKIKDVLRLNYSSMKVIGYSKIIKYSPCDYCFRVGRIATPY